MLGLKKIAAMALAGLLLVSLAGCSKKQVATQQDVMVKTMQVIKRDTPLTYDYTGFIEAQNDVQVKSKVTGMVVQKLVNGGDKVEAGQLLYVIDPRNYNNSLLNAQANLVNAQANLANVQKDYGRYESLYNAGAVSRQSLDNYSMQLAQAQAQVNAQQALVSNAQVDLTETEIRAPFAGKIDTNTVAEGTFVTAGTTALTSISSSDPMRAKFSMAETEYLRLLKSANNAGSSAISNLTLKLSDGSEYPYKGTVTQVDRGVGEGTGTLTLKATFENPGNVLLPGMFAHVTAVGDTVANAILIPQRAVKELLYKKFVYVVDADNKVDMKEVVLGPRVGRLWLVESGLDGTETIVVEGIQKVNKGSKVKPTTMTEADLDTGVAK